MQRKVVITGLGVVSSIGVDKTTFFQSLVEGRSGIRRVTCFDPTGYSCQIAGEVWDNSYKERIDLKRRRRMSLVTQFASAAAQMAMEDSGLNFFDLPPSTIGVILGTSAGSYREGVEQQSLLLERGVDAVNTYMIVSVLGPNTTAAEIAIDANAQGPTFIVSSACASSLHSVAVAADMIKSGTLDVSVTGGFEATITPLGYATLGKTEELATLNEYPERASRPFDQQHDGLVPSEGSCILILEEKSHAEKRNAFIYGELLGYALGCEAYSAFALEPTGESAINSLRTAFARAEMVPSELEWVNAHGSACPNWDRKEAKILKTVLADAASSIPISATKSVMGHTYGAAGAFQIASAVLAMHNNYLLPTINLETPDPECDGLNYVRQARSASPQNCLINSFGYGGHNSFLLLGKG